MSRKEPIEVTGIMLRNEGESLIVEAEIGGEWRVIIREWVGPMAFAISHIIEPRGIREKIAQARRKAAQK